MFARIDVRATVSIVILFTIVASLIPLRPLYAADAVAVQALDAPFMPGSTFVLSRNGSSLASISPAGGVAAIRNAFQFDQERAALPSEFDGAKVLAVSYYGTVFAWRQTVEGCEVIASSTINELYKALVITAASGCTVRAAATNVTDTLAVVVTEQERERLFVVAGRLTELLWDSQSTPETAEKIESLALNDLNTLVFTVSKVNSATRALSTFYWVPARGVRTLELPKRAGRNVVVRDVNNKNQYLLGLARGTALFDPGKKLFLKLPGRGTRLTPTGRPFSSSALFVTEKIALKMSCFARTRFKGKRVSLLTVDDERNLLVLIDGGAIAGPELAKIVPLKDRGFPEC